MSKTDFENYERLLEDYVENARQASVTVCDFQAQNQSVLNNRINSLILKLAEIERVKSRFTNVLVPLDVLGYIDEGKNPQLFTRDCFEEALTRNEELRGKINTLKRFKVCLIAELSKVFPNEMTKYRAVRAAHAQAQSNAAAGANGAVSLDAAGLSLGTPTHSNAAYSPADYSASNTPS